MNRPTEQINHVPLKITHKLMNHNINTHRKTKEAVLRSLVSSRNMQVSQGGLVYNGFGENAGNHFSQAQLLSHVGGIIGAGLSSYTLFPAFDNVRQALPMVQSFLEMALVICIPVLLLFSAWGSSR